MATMVSHCATIAGATAERVTRPRASFVGARARVTAACADKAHHHAGHQRIRARAAASMRGVAGIAGLTASPKPGVAGGIRPGRGRVAVVTRAAKKGGSKLTPEERRARREARERREAEEAELAAFEAEEAARLAAGGVEDDLDGFHAGDDAGFDETVAEVGDEQLEELEEEEEEEEEEVVEVAGDPSHSLRG